MTAPTYTGSFVIFWGFMFSVGHLTGGLLSIALVAVMLLILVHHEHAHLVQCERCGLPVTAINFSWLGGSVVVDIKDREHAIKILGAGLLNSAGYAGLSLFLLVGVRSAGYWLAWNFADPTPLGLLYWMQFLNSIALVSVLVVVSNVLPIEYRHKKHGIITTDGWAIVRLWRGKGSDAGSPC